MTHGRLTQEAVETVGDSTPKLRLTQAVVEIIGDATPKLRETQEAVEVVGNSTPKLRLSQEVVEVIAAVQHPLVMTQESVEVGSTVNPALRLTQLVAEYIGANTPTAMLLTQEVVEVLASTSEDNPALRLTQEAVEVVMNQPNASRVTAIYRLTMIDAPAAGRVTSIVRLTMADFDSAARATSVIRLTLAEAVPCLTFWTTLWRMERSDGVVFAFTSHDQDIVFRQETYRTCASLQASAAELGATLGDVGNMEVVGMITDDSITEEDLFAGLFDGADIEVWLFPWSDAGGETPRRLIKGKTGQLSQRVSDFTAEILTPSQQLQQKPLIELVTPTCRFELGDARCTVDLEALRLTGTVTDLAAANAQNQAGKRIFFDTSRAEADGYWSLGTLTFTSGANTGISSEIKSYDLSSGEFVLWDTMLHAIEVGDGYSVVPGCDKVRSTCVTKFNNVINFGGFPDLPGADEIAKTPFAGGGIPG